MTETLTMTSISPSPTQLKSTDIVRRAMMLFWIVAATTTVRHEKCSMQIHRHHLITEVNAFPMRLTSLRRDSRVTQIVPPSIVVNRRSSPPPVACAIRRGTKIHVGTEEHWMDFLLFQGQTPNFDVIAKTQEYTATSGYRRFALRDIPAEYYDSRYIFRGPIVGPLNRQDLVETNTIFAFDRSFPDLDRQTFGFTVDPENQFRVLFFERWIGTHTGEVSLLNGAVKASPTGKKAITPVFPFAIVWTPEGKIIYECLTTAVDRFEKNSTMGKVAAFGLLETAGLSLRNLVGDPLLILQQKLNRWANSSVQTYSEPSKVPSWWKSKAVGAEINDL